MSHVGSLLSGSEFSGLEDFQDFKSREFAGVIRIKRAPQIYASQPASNPVHPLILRIPILTIKKQLMLQTFPSKVDQ
jgi:hypothetical protein